MRAASFSKRVLANATAGRKAFTLIELLVVAAIISILASLLFPALAKSRDSAQGAMCLNNVRQLGVGWNLYADDHETLLPYNLGMNGASLRTNINWVNNVMTWDLSPDNTNEATITDASMGSYLARNTSVYRCPSDHEASSPQRGAGWGGRIRSYSMNAMIGDAGDFTTNGYNVNNPYYTQFFKMPQIGEPSEIFVFLDEHPDSIDDGYFLNKAPVQVASDNDYGIPTPSSANWIDLPASYHNRSTEFSFADGHAAPHRWLGAKVLRPVEFSSIGLPLNVGLGAGDDADFNWIIAHMSYW